MARAKRTSERVPPGTYERLAALRGEQCWICGAPPKTRRLHIDHLHGAKRDEVGLLCFRCNNALPAWITEQWLIDARYYISIGRVLLDNLPGS